MRPIEPQYPDPDPYHPDPYAVGKVIRFKPRKSDGPKRPSPIMPKAA